MSPMLAGFIFTFILGAVTGIYCWEGYQTAKARGRRIRSAFRRPVRHR